MAKVKKGVKIKTYPTLRFFIPIGIEEKSGFQNDNPSTLMLSICCMSHLRLFYHFVKIQDASPDSSMTPTMAKQLDYGPFCTNVRLL